MNRAQKIILSIFTTFSIGVMVASYATDTGIARDFSALSTAELTKFKLEEMGEEDLKSFRAEIRKRSMDLSYTEKEASRSSQREHKKSQGGGQGKGGMGRGH